MGEISNDPTRDFFLARMLALERRMGHPHDVLRVPTSRSFVSRDTRAQQEFSEAEDTRRCDAAAIFPTLD